MRYQLDHDFHIHSQLSPCSSDPGQTPERILAYAKANHFRHIVLTDHFWDEDVPCAGPTWEGYAHISKSLPLPQDPEVQFHFGCEGDMDRFSVVGIHRKNFHLYDFMVIPVNHLHLGFATLQKPEGWSPKYQTSGLVQRFWNLMQLELPFNKVGLAHITWGGVNGNMPNPGRTSHLDILDMIPDSTWEKLFTCAQERGMGIELNETIAAWNHEEKERVLRPYRIAKSVGCKFYMGSDAHHPADLDGSPDRMQALVNALDLTEEDKFRPFG